MKQEKLLRALNDVGDDLLHMAAHRRFPNPWRKWLATAACVVLVISLTTLVLPYLPMGCGASDSLAGHKTAPTESAAPSEAAPETEDSILAKEEPPEMPECTPEADAAAEESAEELHTVVRNGVSYILTGEPMDEAPTDLGEELGTVEDSTRRELIGCPIYAAPHHSGTADIYVLYQGTYLPATAVSP